MRKTTFLLRQRALRFRRFTRKSYGLFSVLGCEVLIGTLSIATVAHARAEGISVNDAEAANDSLSRKELKLDEVVVTGSRVPLTQAEAAKMVSVISRDDIDRAGAESINDVLKLATGVDVRQRGGFGVQTDISARGGNFDQITILINGVNISSPHTGHLSADFPISPDDIERIEVIEGASSRVFGTSAFNGTVNIVTKRPSTPTLPQRGGSKCDGLVNVEGGSYGYFGANGRASLVTGPVWNSLSVGFNRSDGATEHSAFESTRVFYDGSWNSSKVQMNWQIGYSFKPYQANTFYSAASRDQWESNERWMAAVNADILIGSKGLSSSREFKGVHLVPQVYFNRWYDHYQWHQGSPSGENYHRVETKGISLNAWTEWLLHLGSVQVPGKTSLGLDLRDERIMSTKLGKLLPEEEWQQTGGHDGDPSKYYKYRDQRLNWSVFFEHDVLLKKWTFSLGLLANMNDGLDKTWRVYPGVDISYRPTDSWKIFASWNMALRMPTFTELYYSASDIVGNNNLKPEKTNDVQIGVKYRVAGFSGETQVFYSHNTDMIDWVKATHSDSHQGGELNTVDFSDGKFHSVNFQRDNIGLEVNAQFLPREFTSEKFPLRMLGVKYCYIHEDSKYDVNVISSKYAMEYLRHKVVVSVDGTILHTTKGCVDLGLDWRWQDRVGEGNDAYGLLDGKLSWDAPRYSLYVKATNILNKEYYDYISIKQPGICIMGGMKWNF